MREVMKKEILLLLTLACVIVSGCRREKSADVEEIFRTVPATTSFVATIDLKSIAEKTGSEVKDGKLDPSSALGAIVGRDADSRSKRALSILVDPKSGIDYSVAVIFADGATTYLTGMIDNTSDFREYAEQISGLKFADNNGVSVCGPFACQENRFWLTMSGRHNIDAETIAEYMALTESQSFAGKKDFAGKLVELDHDVQGWADINGAMNVTNMSFQNRALAKVAMETLFSDGGFAGFTLSFDKGEAKAEFKILDSKGKPAKFNFPAGKIDMSVLNRLQGQASTLGAISVPAKMIRQMQKQTAGTPSMLGIVLSALGPVDGTVAVAADNGEINGVIATDGGSTADLQSLLRELSMTPSLDGKLLLFKGGQKGGNVKARPVAEMAGMLKGCIAGMVVSGDGMSNPQVDMTVITLDSEDGSVMLKMRALMLDKKNNALMSLIK